MATEAAARTAVVSGGSAGIGRAVVEALGAAGWAVGVGARREGPVGEVVAAVERAGGRAAGARLDVGDPATIDPFFDEIERALGPVDTIVSSAAHATPGRFWERAPDAIASEVAVGLTGALLFARAGIARLVDRGASGDVIFVSSTTAAVPWPYKAVYAATKAGIEQAARTIALELEGTGVRVGIVRVGNTIGTEWASEWGEDEFRIAGEWSRFGVMRHDGFMEPRDVGETVRRVLETPRGVQLDLVSVHPEAPRGSQRPPIPGSDRSDEDDGTPGSR